MKVLKIDVVTKTIIEIELEKGLKPIYEALGNDCNMFDCPVELDQADVIYCDEEGLFHDNIGGFMMKNWSYPIVGNGLVIGTNTNNGESVSCKTTKQELEKMIIWVTVDDCQIWIDKNI